MVGPDFLAMRVRAKISNTRCGFTDRQKWVEHADRMMERCMRVIQGEGVEKRRGQRAVRAMGLWLEGITGEDDRYFWKVALPTIRRINPQMK